MTRPPMPTVCRRNFVRAPSNAFAVWPSTGSESIAARSGVPVSAITASDVVFRRLLRGVRKDLRGFVELDQLAEIHERRVVADARGLLHVVRDDQHRQLVAQRGDQLLDLRGLDRLDG